MHQTDPLTPEPFCELSVQVVPSAEVSAVLQAWILPVLLSWMPALGCELPQKVERATELMLAAQVRHMHQRHKHPLHRTSYSKVGHRP